MSTATLPLLHTRFARRPLSRRATVAVRRAVLVLVIAALALVAALLIRPAATAATAGTDVPEQTHTRTVSVVPGQSLWSIATEVSGGADTRDVIVEITELNNLSGGVVHPGQQLIVPAR